MLRILHILPLALILFSCSTSESETPKSQEKSEIKPDKKEVEVDEEDQEPIIYTAEALVDGPDAFLWIITPGELEQKPEEFTECDQLDIVPHEDFDEGGFDNMIGIYVNDFKLYDPFDLHSGKVKLYYDRQKLDLAAEFYTRKGKPDGEATIYDKDGSVYMKREYDNGEWIKSHEAPACSDWTFDQSTSSLKINDLENGQEEGTIKLMPSVNADNASFEKILDKATYERPFKINGEEYTGALEAYYESTDFEMPLHFLLEFKDGKLHGDIKIYNGIEMLELHEVFNEGELDTTIYVINWDEMDGVAKPIIYFYPEDTTSITVSLDFKGELTHTYPRYNEGWKVTACPDGTLFDETGKEYYALYWEGDNSAPFTMNEGTVVKGENTIEFLEESLATLGLNRREANEFIMYWLPKMENNAYNFIHFSTSEYEEMAKLNIAPKPETMIRVMMVFQPLQNQIKVKEQDLEALKKVRNGFTVVEWGGKEVPVRIL